MNEQEIKFNHNPDKILDAVTWIVQNNPSISIFYIVKILYYADKKHLITYGRPITGDTYKAMKDGPVTFYIFNILNRNNEVVGDGDKLLDKFKENFHFRSTSSKTELSIKGNTVKEDFDYLSESDIECLNFGLDECKDLSWMELRHKIHGEFSWKNVNQPSYKAVAQQMKFEDFFDGDPNAQEKIDELQEISNYIVF